MVQAGIGFRPKADAQSYVRIYVSQGRNHNTTSKMQGESTINWEAIGAVGEVAGALGVIITLVYLSVQIRASTLASRVESKLAASGMYTDFLKTLIESPEINDIFLRGRENIESLSTEEFHRFSNMAFQAFSFFSASKFQHSSGALSESDWYEHLAIIKFWLRGRGSRTWWKKYGMNMYGPDFVAFVDSELQKVEATEQIPATNTN